MMSFCLFIIALAVFFTGHPFLAIALLAMAVLWEN
jgi:hypothetical protein